MDFLLSYLTTENVILIVVVLAIIAGGWIAVILVAKSKEKKRKEHPFDLTKEHEGKLFKILKLDDEDNQIGFLSFNPTREYSSGTGGQWFSTKLIPDEIKAAGNIIRVIKGPDDKVKIVPVRYDRLPSEKDMS